MRSETSPNGAAITDSHDDIGDERQRSEVRDGVQQGDERLPRPQVSGPGGGAGRTLDGAAGVRRSSALWRRRVVMGDAGERGPRPGRGGERWGGLAPTLRLAVGFTGDRMARILFSLFFVFLAAPSNSDIFHLDAETASQVEVVEFLHACRLAEVREEDVAAIRFEYHTVFLRNDSCVQDRGNRVCDAFAVNNRNGECGRLPKLGHRATATGLTPDDIVWLYSLGNQRSKPPGRLLTLARYSEPLIMDAEGGYALVIETRRHIEVFVGR